ncbi:MAG: DUF669 domain-containing protein [Phycisphaerae bacterium]|nr:DUF669 domain-containing protein [Phycisphaerae bacterium]
MANLNGFNANNVEPDAGFEPIPAGKYPVVITKTEMKPTKNGDGSYLEIELAVTEGEFQGRLVWDRLCLDHPNRQTVEIACSKLSAICRAVGVMEPQDSVDLHNIPLVITVKLKEREDNGDLTNEVKGYGEKSSLKPQTQPAGNTDKTSPWKRS